MKLQSTYALLDVKNGRVALRKALFKRDKISVVIHGTIDSEFGYDDGESQEFNMTVAKIETTKEPKP